MIHHRDTEITETLCALCLCGEHPRATVTIAAMMRAVVLLSGGLDSATVLAIAKHDGRTCHAISFTYGQRHEIELAAAQRVARSMGVAEHVVYPLDLRVFGASAL